MPRARVPLGGGGGWQGGHPTLLLLPGLDTLELLWIPDSGLTTIPDKERGHSFYTRIYFR